MYAVLRTGGQQFKVNEGDSIRVAKMETPVGEEITLDDVLLLGGGDTVVGAPTVRGAAVSARVVGHGKADNVIVFKMKRRKNYRRKNGHRQHYTELEITGIHYDPTEQRTKAAKRSKKEEAVDEAVEAAEATDVAETAAVEAAPGVEAVETAEETKPKTRSRKKKADAAGEEGEAPGVEAVETAEETKPKTRSRKKKADAAGEEDKE